MGTVPCSLCALNVLLKMNFKVRYHTMWVNTVRLEGPGHSHLGLTKINDSKNKLGRKICSCGADWNTIALLILSLLVLAGVPTVLGKLDTVFDQTFACCEHGRVRITEWRARVEAEVAKVPDFSAFL